MWVNHRSPKFVAISRLIPASGAASIHQLLGSNRIRVRPSTQVDRVREPSLPFLPASIFFPPCPPPARAATNFTCVTSHVFQLLAFSRENTAPIGTSNKIALMPTRVDGALCSIFLVCRFRSVKLTSRSFSQPGLPSIPDTFDAVALPRDVSRPSDLRFPENRSFPPREALETR